MKTAFLTLILLGLSLNLKADSDYKDDYLPLPTISTVRTLKCELSLNKNGHLIPAAGLLKDVEVPSDWYSEDQSTALRSELTLTVALDNLETTVYTERGDQDPQEDRDSDPKSHGGWGGKGFYQSEKSGHLVVLSAQQEQQNKANRTYDIVVGDYETQTEFYRGLASCIVQN